MNHFTTLALHCHEAEAPSRVLDGLIFKALREEEGQVWYDQIGEDDVWFLRDRDDHAAWEGPARYTEHLDEAFTTRVPGMRLSGMREFVRPDSADRSWKSCGCEIEALGLIFVGRGTTLALAFLHATLQAHAHLQGTSEG